MSTPADPIALTRRWLERAVIGLNLCPFAKSVHVKDQVRLVLCEARNEAGLLRTLRDELLYLQRADPARVDTTLIVHPHVLGDFLDYNDFLATADALLMDLALEGAIQIASFHPDYRFAGTRADEVGNNTNRSPFPMLHLLREDSVARAVDAFPDPDSIVQRNLRTLERLGPQGWRRLLDE